MPEALRYWTADEVAECLPLRDPDRTLYAKLWLIRVDAENPTPMGGDPGERPGTVETPDGRIGDFDDQGLGWWDKLLATEQAEVARAYAEEIARQEAFRESARRREV
jgi:hypothetical protein